MIQPPIHIFNRRLKRRQRDRASRLLPQHDFLIKLCAEHITERFDGEIKPDFPTALHLGAGGGYVMHGLKGKGGITRTIQADHSYQMLHSLSGTRLCMDEEFLPFGAESLDLVTSLLTLHWINDLPGCMIQIQRALKPRGLFLAVLLGGSSLKELRQSMLTIDEKIFSGISPRFSPIIDAKDAGGLLQRAGFHLPVADTEIVTAQYDSVIRLLHDLRGMGETNALSNPTRKPLTREFLSALEDHYREHFATDEGLLNATFEIITLTGWKD